MTTLRVRTFVAVWLGILALATGPSLSAFAQNDQSGSEGSGEQSQGSHHHGHHHHHSTGDQGQDGQSK